MGRAIADYHKTGIADRLRVFSPMFEEDEIPLKTLFRSYKDMPEIERKALDLAKDKTKLSNEEDAAKSIAGKVSR